VKALTLLPYGIAAAIFWASLPRGEEGAKVRAAVILYGIIAIVLFGNAHACVTGAW
jgi:hypothetical protein